MRRTRGNVVHSIPFDDASRDDDARSCPGTAVHASALRITIAPSWIERSPRLSYLLWKVADKTGKTEKCKRTRKRANSIRERHSSGQKSNHFSVTLRGQTACFARYSMLSPFAAAFSMVSQTLHEQRLVVVYPDVWLKQNNGTLLV